MAGWSRRSLCRSPGGQQRRTGLLARGFTRKIGLYARHPEIGADRLALAGSDPLTVAWAREHHQPEDTWTIPHHLAIALKESDDD